MTPFGKVTHHDDGTHHEDRVRRVTVAKLDGSFGTDRDKRVIVALLAGDVIELRPERTQRPETISALDVYRYAMRCRVNRAVLEKARIKKERKADRLAAERLKRAEKRLIER